MASVPQPTLPRRSTRAATAQANRPAASTQSLNTAGTKPAVITNGSSKSVVKEPTARERGKKENTSSETVYAGQNQKEEGQSLENISAQSPSTIPRPLDGGTEATSISSRRFWMYLASLDADAIKELFLLCTDAERGASIPVGARTTSSPTEPFFSIQGPGIAPLHCALNEESSKGGILPDTRVTILDDDADVTLVSSQTSYVNRTFALRHTRPQRVKATLLMKGPVGRMARSSSFLLCPVTPGLSLPFFADDGIVGLESANEINGQVFRVAPSADAMMRLDMEQGIPCTLNLLRWDDTGRFIADVLRKTTQVARSPASLQHLIDDNTDVLEGGQGKNLLLLLEKPAGGSLLNYLGDPKFKKEENVQRFAKHVLAALQWLHQQNAVLGKALKPSNILLTSTDVDRASFVVGGLTSLQEVDPECPSVTNFRTYDSPFLALEAFRERSVNLYKLDIYACGMMILLVILATESDPERRLATETFWDDFARRHIDHNNTRSGINHALDILSLSGTKRQSVLLLLDALLKAAPGLRLPSLSTVLADDWFTKEESLRQLASLAAMLRAFSTSEG